jgi:IS5 family transposase
VPDHKLKRFEFSLQNDWHPHTFKRMRKALKTLRGYTGRVMRDLRRLLQAKPEQSLRDPIIAKLAPVWQLLHQQPKGSDKIYALHETEVDCGDRGHDAHKPGC